MASFLARRLGVGGRLSRRGGSPGYVQPSFVARCEIVALMRTGRTTGSVQLPRQSYRPMNGTATFLCCQVWRILLLGCFLFALEVFAKSGRQEMRLLEVLEDAEVLGVESSSLSWSRWWRRLESRCLGGVSEAVLYSDLSLRLSLLCTVLRL